MCREPLVLSKGQFHGRVRNGCGIHQESHSISVTSCSIFIMGNNRTNGEFRLITFRLEK